MHPEYREALTAELTAEIVRVIQTLDYGQEFESSTQFPEERLLVSEAIDKLFQDLSRTRLSPREACSILLTEVITSIAVSNMAENRQ